MGGLVADRSAPWEWTAWVILDGSGKRAHMNDIPDGSTAKQVKDRIRKWVSDNA